MVLKPRAGRNAVLLAPSISGPVGIRGTSAPDNRTILPHPRPLPAGEGPRVREDRAETSHDQPAYSRARTLNPNGSGVLAKERIPFSAVAPMNGSFEIRMFPSKS